MAIAAAAETSASVAQKTFELANNVQEVDKIYKCARGEPSEQSEGV